MKSEYKLHLPESHVDILHVVSAIAWADGNLTEEESDLLINQFKEDLPPNPTPLLYLEDTPPLFTTLTEDPTISKQLSERITAELALKEIVVEYKYNPIPLAALVKKLKTEEDRCLALKLAYMVIKAGRDHSGELISLEEKKAYRQLVDLLNLDEDLVKEIELQANQDLEKFQHPFQAFISSIKKGLGLEG
jgi:tellurite resistance protein